MRVDFGPRSRRVGMLASFAIAATLALPAGASALGPGGWDNLGTNGSGGAALDGRALAFNTDLPGKLIAGGVFTGAGIAPGATTADDKIAVWDGTNWSSLGPLAGLTGGDVFALESDPATGRIYAGGAFTNAGGNPAVDFLAMWDTNAPAAGWQPMCAPLGGGGSVKALKLVGTRLFVGGEGQDWDGPPNNLADYLFECDTTAPGGSIIPMVGTTGPVLALATDASGYLYAGGNFTNAHALTNADYVVKYGPLPALTPSGLGGGSAIDNIGVDSLVTIGNDLYVGTDDLDVGAPAPIVQADNVARYSSATDTWSAPGTDTTGTNGYFAAADMGTPQVNALATSGTTVYAAGNWSNANGEALSDRVAAFSSTCVPVAAFETCWDSVGHDGTSSNGPLDNVANSLTVFNGNLIAGGNFTNAGGDPLADFISCFKVGANPCVTPPPVNPPVTLPPTAAPAAVAAVAKKKCKKGFKLKKGKCKRKKKKK